MTAARVGIGGPVGSGKTALIEAIVLGDRGLRHTETFRALVAAGADHNIPGASGIRPLTLAQQRGYRDIFEILESNGAKL